jgi:hypothetical protein
MMLLLCRSGGEKASHNRDELTKILLLPVGKICLGPFGDTFECCVAGGQATLNFLLARRPFWRKRIVKKGSLASPDYDSLRQAARFG